MHTPENCPTWVATPTWLNGCHCRALGNAVTVNVAEWIGRRIAATA